MVDLFDYLYYTISDKKGKVFSLLRFVIKILANSTIPLYYRSTSKLKRNSLVGCKTENVIISMTSFPARINDLWKVIESIMRQSVKPQKIVLWLSKEQFSSIDTLPKRLLNMRSRGLEIIMRDNDLRSHKKYCYTVREFPDKDFIIMDDDVFYNTKTLEYIIKLHTNYLNTVCCNLGDRILDHKGFVMRYKNWNKHKPEVNQKRKYILPIGVGGVYYPAGALLDKVKDESIFMKICPKADDLWLWAMATANNATFACTENKLGYLPVLIRNNVKLSTTNIECTNSNESGNDVQIKKILSYLKEEKILNLTYDE